MQTDKFYHVVLVCIQNEDISYPHIMQHPPNIERKSTDGRYQNPPSCKHPSKQTQRKCYYRYQIDIKGEVERARRTMHADAQPCRSTKTQTRGPHHHHRVMEISVQHVKATQSCSNPIKVCTISSAPPVGS